MLKPRPATRSLEAYRPPLGERNGLRFDFNENTAGCSPAVMAALRGLTSVDLASYPDRQRGERMAAEHLGIRPDRLLLCNGVDEGIHLICEAFLQPDDEVIVPVPTFAMYEIYARAAGAKIVRVPAEKNFAFPRADILGAVTPRTKLILVANPNNPTGAVTSNETLSQIAKSTSNAGLVVDEAYFDFYGSSILPEIERLPNLFVARTFSKAYGMAGLRLGLLASCAGNVELLRKTSSPYNVNAAALACLPAALGDSSYVRGYVAEVVEGRAQLHSLLQELEVQHWPSHANFVLTQFGSSHDEFLRLMRDRGILVRDRDGDPGCAGCVRISLGTRQQNAQLFAALREVVETLRARSSL